ncbi:T9SS type A sorting domain-containing protein, partial [Ferruginibacter sp.]|uniref:T9SS type A sorting domain-containing protein n=1 Tax=Ferruginibacter sp. TaxID=1940288 RepID=UPI0019B5E4B4
LKVANGSDVTILSGTVFTIDSLTLTPSSNFTLSNVTLSKSATIIHSQTNPYISRVYQFSNTSNPFSGSILMKYSDGAELNGINEADLTLNIHNGVSWNAYNATTRDGTNNFVLTDGLTGITLNELTLASQFAALPLTWLSFDATKEKQTTLLKWSTASEQNTKSFAVQHSSEGVNWNTIAILPAAGNSTIAIEYNYVHTNPIMGTNYYRIKETDLDNHYSYSPVRKVLFTTLEQPFTVLGNPVANGILVVKLIELTPLSFYTSDGKLLWQQLISSGIKIIDVSRYAKGSYFLRSANYTQKIVIQ